MYIVICQALNVSIMLLILSMLDLDLMDYTIFRAKMFSNWENYMYMYEIIQKATYLCKF